MGNGKYIYGVKIDLQDGISDCCYDILEYLTVHGAVCLQFILTIEGVMWLCHTFSLLSFSYFFLTIPERVGWPNFNLDISHKTFLIETEYTLITY